MRRPLDWLRDRPLTADAILAGVLVGLGLVGLAVVRTAPGTNDPTLLTAVVVVAQGASVTWRRRAPIAVLVGSMAAGIVVWLAGWPEVATSVAPIIATYSVGAHSPARAGRVAAGAAGVVMFAVLVLGRTVGDGPDLTVDVLVANVAVFGAAFILGEMMRGRRERLQDLEERAVLAESSRTAAAQRAVAAERTRIARELHDVVAHSVSVMVVQAGAARRVLERDPEAAIQALCSVEDIGRQSVTELRRVLGVLRREDDQPSRSPQPSVASLQSLVESTREAGLQVDMTVEGEPRPLPPGVELSAYRIVQEALTNVLKHAGPAEARVRLRYGAEDLGLEVVDDGRGAAAVLNGPEPGHGLLGMRERVSLFGGDLAVGNRNGGGYSVKARLPSGGAGVTCRILVVDDQVLVRTGFRMILEAEPDFEVVGEAGDGSEAIERCRQLRPDIVLMDIRMPGMDGVEATRRLAGPEAADPVRVLILTTFDLDEYVYDALRAGASGFLLKDAPAEDLANAVRVVARGDALLAPSVTRRLIAEFASQPVTGPPPPGAVGDLTDRETEVLLHMARGMSNAEVAAAIHVSETTVKTHVGRVLQKLHLRDRVQAVVLAYETGLVQPGLGAAVPGSRPGSSEGTRVDPPPG